MALRFRIAFLATAAVVLVAVVLNRLTGLVPDLFPWASIVAVPAVACLVALATTRAPDRRQAARLVDRHGRTPRDLYLSFTTLDSSGSAFRPIVVEQAEAQADSVASSEVVPFRWMKSAGTLVLSVAVLAAAIAFLPRLDPFGQNAERQRETRERERLAETIKATKIRSEQIREELSGTGDPIDETLKELEKTLQLAKPQMQQANLRKLEEHQQEVGALWRQMSEEKLRKAMETKPVQQSFGKLDPEKAKEIQEQLREGNLDEVRKSLEGMRKEAAELGGMPDSAEKRKRQAQLQRRLESLADAVAKAVHSKPLSDSLSRALEQLDMAARDAALSKEAMEAMRQSLNLTEQELEALSQSLADLKDLEDALRSLQMAKQLNARGELDGESAGQCEGIGDYADLYERMLAGRGKGGTGPGMRGPGTGAGGVAPENEKLDSDFKTEKSRGRLAGGKLLLEWKTNEVSQPGEAQVRYEESLQAVKQGVSEAILLEQIPAGYHDGIQRYFDSLQPDRTQ
jgi:tetratricopeptide (TPR) repeat protein